MSTTRIEEQGYRPYEGVRGRVGVALRSTVWHTLRHMLGLRRRARSKLLPWGIAALSYLPALGFVAVTLFLPEQLLGLAGRVLPGPQAYLGGIILLVYLAAALAGPAALCGDRRSGALALYLASPLSRDTYLLAKAAAVAAFLALVTVVPPLLYVLGTTLADAGPEGTVAVLLTAGRAVAAGLALAALFGSLSLAAASFTDRQTAAAGSVILYALISGAVVGTTVFSLDAPTVLVLLDVNQVALGTVAAVYGGALPGDLQPATVGVAFGTWTLGLTAVTRWRYQRLAVTR